MNHLLLFEQFLAEFSYHEGGIEPAKILSVFDPAIDYSESDFEKDYPAEAGRTLHLDDLLHEEDGRRLLAREDVDGTKGTRLADLVAKMGIRISADRAAIEHPREYFQIWNALVRPGALGTGELIGAPGVADLADLEGPAWSDESLAKLGNDGATAARTFKLSVMKSLGAGTEPVEMERD